MLETIARAMTASLRAGGKILWCGNGGSAGDSQHLAAEIGWAFPPRAARHGLGGADHGHFGFDFDWPTTMGTRRFSRGRWRRWAWRATCWWASRPQATVRT